MKSTSKPFKGQRIVVVGACGSGKTTLAKQLGEIKSIPAVDLDELHWLPNWQTVSSEELMAKLQKAVAEPAWVISGNYGKAQPIIIAGADTFIWLDYSFCVVLIRLLRRTWRRVVKQEPCCNGNYESWRLVFSRESIVVWLFKSYWRRRRAYEALVVAPETAHLQIVRFRRPAETTRWLASQVKS